MRGPNQTNDIPEPLRAFSIVGNDKYILVIGGPNDHFLSKRTVYRLSLWTYEWTTISHMGTTRRASAAVLKGNYIYVFGGYCGYRFVLKSVERYLIVANAWEYLPGMGEENENHCAVAGQGSDIYIVGGEDDCCPFEIADAASLLWKTEEMFRQMLIKTCTSAVLWKDQYLVAIDGDYIKDHGAYNAKNSFMIFGLSNGLLHHHPYIY